MLKVWKTDHMTKAIEFAKLSGSGNDFICIDGRAGQFADILGDAERLGDFVRSLCHRGTGIGADGIIFAVQPEIPEAAEVAARFLESDGSETDLCGNGTACFVRWVIDNGWHGPDEIKILTSAGVVRGRRLADNYVRACIPLPEDMQTDLQLQLDNGPWGCDYVVTGIPHVVSFVEDIQQVDVASIGPALRHHEQFSPRGVNANFAQVLGTGQIALRTYEFGVEGETLACGTGSAAAAVLAVKRFNWPAEYSNGELPVRVLARSGD